MRKKRFFRYRAALIAAVICSFMAMTCFAKERPPETSSEEAITFIEKEKEYIQEHPTVSIAIDTSWTPYGFEQADGSCGGIIPNVMSVVAERAGMKVQFLSKDTYADAIKECNTGETMLVSGIADDSKMAEQNNLLRTNPYITIGYSAVTKGKITDLYTQGANYRVALCVGTYAKMAMQEKMPDYEFVEYHTNQECMEAVLNDEADMALVANYSVGYFSGWHEYSKLKTIQINDFTWKLCFGVNKECDPILIDILNKSIGTLTENDVNQAIYAGAMEASATSHRITDILYEQPALVAGVVSAIVGLAVLTVFLFILQKRKKSEIFRENQFKEDIRQKDLMLNSIPAGIGVFEIINGVAQQRYMNDSFYRLLGDTRENHSARIHGDFCQGIFAEDRGEFTNAVREILSGKDSAEFAYRALKADGTTTWIRLTALVTAREKKGIVVYCSLTGVDNEVKARQNLQESADIVNAAMHSANMTVWSYDVLSHTVTQRNASANYGGLRKVVENVPESLIESGYIHPDSAEAYRQAFAKIETSEEPIQGDFMAQNSEHTGYWWERMILTPVFENGKVTKAIGTSINITYRKKKESQYLQLVERMEEANDSNLIAKGRHNLSNNKILYYWKKADGSTELPEDTTFESILAHMTDSAVLTVDSEWLKKNLERKSLLRDYADGHAEGNFEYRRYKKDGHTIWSLLKYNLFEEPNSGDVVFFVYTYDITERVRENRMLEKLGSTEYDVLGLIDVKTHHFESKTIKGVKSIAGSRNRYVLGLFEDIIQQQVTATVREGERKELEKCLTVEAVTEKLKEMDVYCVTFSAIRENQSNRRKKMNFSYLDDSKTTIFYYCTDITEMYDREQEQLHKTEDALEAARIASAAKTEFFSRMSHDMRTPMNGILGMVELSEEETNLQVLKQNIAKIKSSGEYLLGLINDTLDFQKIESGKLTLEPQVVYARELLESITGMIQSAADEKGVDFTVILGNVDMDWYVKADPLRIKQIFINLLSNAVKFTPPGGTVEFGFQLLEREGMVSHDRITVADTGLGMSREFLEKGIFQAFSQEFNVVTANYAGTGLGLSIAKKLIELMGGRISVESELGVGSRFTVDIDFERVDASTYREAENKGIKRQESAGEILQGKKVLLAEDHPLNAEIAKKLLGKVGCQVTWARDGKECLSLLASSKVHQYDMVLMDVRMPVMDGIAATREIRLMERKDIREIPIIAMTANAYADDVKKCLQAGMNGHIAKPIESLLMFETMAEILEHHQGEKR